MIDKLANFQALASIVSKFWHHERPFVKPKYVAEFRNSRFHSILPKLFYSNDTQHMEAECEINTLIVISTTKPFFELDDEHKRKDIVPRIFSTR